MNAVSQIRSNVLEGFMSRIAAMAAIDPANVYLLEGSTDDVRADLVERGRTNLAHARNFRGRRPQQVGGGRRAGARLEENYLYSSRRFPAASNNTIGAGGLTAGNFPYFNRGAGEDASGLGFPSGATLTDAETNLEVGGYLPQGTNFVGSQLGITFNSDIVTADLNVFMDVAALYFSKAGGQFTLRQGPVKFWPGGMGGDGYAATTATTTTKESVHNGVADIRAVRSLRLPRVLKEKEVFTYGITISRTTKATDGTTIALTNFVIPTIWLFGGQKNVIPS